MREPRWVSRLVVYAAHLDQLREHGGLTGVRDENSLDAALARPRQKWTCDASVDLASLAAAYAFGLVNAHPFNDGNKRIGFLTMSVFLGLNRKDLNATDTDVVQAMVALVAGSLKEHQLAEWVRSRLVRFSME